MMDGSTTAPMVPAVPPTLPGRARRAAAASFLALLATTLGACGGDVTRDEDDDRAAGGTTPTTPVATGGTAVLDPNALTCGDWLAEAVRVARERCGWDGISFNGYAENRRLDPELAASVCLPNLEEKDCEAPDPEFIADACEAACAK